MTSDIKFAYYRPGFRSEPFIVPSGHEFKGGVTVAYSVHGCDSFLQNPDPVVVLEYAIAICDVRDTFVKSEGRALAEDRLVLCDPNWSGVVVLGRPGIEVPMASIDKGSVGYQVVDSTAFGLFSKVANLALGHVYLNKLRGLCSNAPVYIGY